MTKLPERNYEIVGLSPANTVLTKGDDGVVSDSGMKPSEFGTWGLSRKERGILRRGMTASGRDRRGRGKGVR